jgi:hypothetical protein
VLLLSWVSPQDRSTRTCGVLTGYSAGVLSGGTQRGTHRRRGRRARSTRTRARRAGSRCCRAASRKSGE